MMLKKLLKSNKPIIMGIVNVTPDSFSDGGKYYTEKAAIEHGLQLLEDGAHILDIGGESTKPGSQTVSVTEEINRIVPVIEALKHKAPLISVDTRNAETMKAALYAGADIINDISALRHDQKSLDVVVKSGQPICLMHMQGTPYNMQKNPSYNNVVDEIFLFFEERLLICKQAGIDENNIIIDVGIGFGKTTAHNLSLLKHLSKFKALNCPILLGVSRKSFIATVSKDEPSDLRLAGSVAGVLWGWKNGAKIFRVHDVKETAQALTVFSVIENAQ